MYVPTGAEVEADGAGVAAVGAAVAGVGAEVSTAVAPLLAAGVAVGAVEDPLLAPLEL